MARNGGVDIKLTDGISDAAVQAKTGKPWSEWFSVLDRAGASAMTHPEIARLLNQRHEVSPWWSQMVTVAYERARGRRVKYERPEGFSVSASRTMPAAGGAVFRAFADASERARWLPDPGLVIRKATPEKSLRITWVDGATSVEVNIYPKADGKSVLSVQHDRLADAAAAERMKEYWSGALAQLRVVLEKR